MLVLWVSSVRSIKWVPAFGDYMEPRLKIQVCVLCWLAVVSDCKGLFGLKTIADMLNRNSKHTGIVYVYLSHHILGDYISTDYVIYINPMTSGKKFAKSMIGPCYQQKMALVWYKTIPARAVLTNSINMLHMMSNKLNLFTYLHIQDSLIDESLAIWRSLPHESSKWHSESMG